MSDQLWTSAKHIAKVDGKEYDWVYVVGVYKSMGGMSMALTVFLDGKRQEVIGETADGMVVLCDKNGHTTNIEKSIFEKSRKKFMKRDLSNAEHVKKVELEIKGRTEKLTLQRGVEWK